MNQQTMMPPTSYAPTQAPVQQLQLPPPGPVQTAELDEARWKAMRADMCEVLSGLAHKLGFNLVADENLLKMGFPVEDGSRFENGGMDMDFEESAIETLGRFEIKGTEFVEIAKRFRYNLMIRNHDDLPEEPSAPQS